MESLDFTLVLGQKNGDLSQAFSSFGNVEVRDFCTQKEI